MESCSKRVEETDDKPFQKCLTADLYTTTIGSYCTWNKNVDLGPWNNSIPTPKEDATIENYYDALQYTLFETNYPETEDRTVTPRQQTSGSQVTIAMLSSPVECMGILLEGARQCPGVMLLILSTSWISKERSRGDPNLFSLFVHKAVTFDTAGRTFLDVFDPPRKVTYFVNFFTDGCTDGQRKDGEPIERDLDCPTSDSLNLVQIIDDKVLTRILMAEAGMQYPETLAFTYNVQHRYPKSEFDDIVIIKLEKINGVQEQVQCEVRKYLNRVKTRVQQKNVSRGQCPVKMFSPEDNVINPKAMKYNVKPSGIMYHGSMGVTFHFTGDEEHVVSAILGLLDSMPENNGVLVEEFYAPYSGDQTESTLDITDLSFRLRSNVCRGLNDTPITTTLVCGVGNKNEPINGDNTQPQSFETTLHQMGLSAHETRLREEVISTSENVLRRIIEFEKGLTIQEKGGVGAQTDIIGIDFVIGQKNGVISPIGIEVNSHDCTINCQLFEFINPRLSGSSLRPLVETMVSRSQEFVLQGRTIVVLGSGGTSKRFIWPIAKSYGVQVVLIDEEGCDVNAKEMCSMFIPYDFSNHVDDIDHADAISEILQSHAVKADGCCTFWEDCVPLTARLCSVLGLMGTGVEGAINAKQKSRTQKILMKRTGDIPHFPRTYLYAGKTVQIKTRVDIPKHMPKFRMPCMLKLEYGSSAVGVKLVRNIEECENEFTRITTSLKSEFDHPGIGLGHGNNMCLTEYHVGTEHDVDIVIFERRLIAAYISDNGPTRKGFFTETVALMPSRLPLDKQGQLITAAYQCCVEIGLLSGVFNVELMMTKTGPKLLEINARMGGFYLRDWINRCYGIDLVKTAFLISCGIKPILPKPKPTCHIMGVMCVPSAHGTLFNDNVVTEKLNDLAKDHEIRYNIIEEEFDLDIAPDMEEPICNIAIVADDKEKAHEGLLMVCDSLGVHNECYDVKKLTESFMV